MVRFPEFGTPTSVRWRFERLNRPSPLRGSNGVVFGPDGLLYVAQFLAGQISAVDITTGRVEVVVPPTGPARAPDDLAFGADGSMYVADITPSRVWRRSPDGEFSLLSEEVRAPNGITCVGDRLFVNEMFPRGRVLELPPDRAPVVLAEGLALGNAMQRGPDGLLYYPHMITGQVWRVGLDGGDAEQVAAEVHEPVAVRFDREGVLHVLSRGEEGIVTRIDPDTGRREVTRTGVAGMDNAAFDRENRMLVSSFASGGITAIEAKRARAVVGRGLNGPYGVAADERGRVYAADHFRLAFDELSTDGLLQQRVGGSCHDLAVTEGAVHVTSTQGEVRTFDPATGSVRTRASELSEPLGVAVLGDALVVAESGSGRVLRIDAGDERSVLAELVRPVGVATDAQQRCYVTDEGRGVVVEVTENGVETIVDELDRPQGVVVVDHELFVLEVGARRLLSVSPSTRASRVEAENLAVGTPPGIERENPPPSTFPPSRPRAFAGLAATPEGDLLLSASGEGTVQRLSTAAQRAPRAQRP
ncbi:SMP-30/gluconolactonase/LRE family protein [Saccharopolyspora halophila]|uniref:SMP-30/gluconolactonase/LRE family protein n=1 Tax=Saccharopolyspora halophila TaxID=405551 RepID=A0ABN3GKU4_9PSEU